MISIFMCSCMLIKNDLQMEDKLNVQRLENGNHPLDVPHFQPMIVIIVLKYSIFEDSLISNYHVQSVNLFHLDSGKLFPTKHLCLADPVPPSLWCSSSKNTVLCKSLKSSFLYEMENWCCTVLKCTDIKSIAG